MPPQELSVLSARLLKVFGLAAVLVLSDASGNSAQTDGPRVIESFSFDVVKEIARDRAAQTHRKPGADTLPPALAKLTYDQFRDIRFSPGNALWRGQGLFEVQFFHRGFNFVRRVNISQVEGTRAEPVAYKAELFDFGKMKRPSKLPADLGFAGFRVHYPLHTPQYRDELIVFLGASYFRVLGRNQGYGLSARGLAIDTGEASGEEFPEFTDFWLVKPKPEDRELIVYALLDSRSLTGAYKFIIRPGGTTQVEVSSEIFPRRAVAKLGIAPLTSMFLYGEDPGGRRFDDFRPEVHDSDGLMMQTGGGEWLWRPLGNPRQLRIGRFMDERPRGFGVIQRDRDFAHYQDNESKYQARPSYWIEPRGEWGKGGVELVEIPTEEEIHDNIVAYWVPDVKLEVGKPLKFDYTLYSYAESVRWPPGGKVVATRVGSADVGSAENRAPASMRRVIIDFQGGDLDGMRSEQPVQAHIEASSGKIDSVTVERIPELGIWRAAFRYDPKDGQPADLRCYLTLYGEALTETWSYLWK